MQSNPECRVVPQISSTKIPKKSYPHSPSIFSRKSLPFPSPLQTHHPAPNSPNKRKMATAFATSSPIVGLRSSSLSSPRLTSGNQLRPTIYPFPTLFWNWIFLCLVCLPRVHQIAGHCEESARRGACIRRKVHLVSDYCDALILFDYPFGIWFGEWWFLVVVCFSFQRDWLRRDLNVIGFGLIGWIAPSSIPVIDGKSLTGLFFESIGTELAHFPSPPPLTSQFW